MIFQLIYTSSAAPDLSGDGLEKLARVAQHRNRARNITGMLLHHEGTILQVLEGEEHQVKSLFQTIKNDPRHNNCMCLIERKSETREFPDWNMGFRQVNGNSQASMFFELTRLSLKSVMPENPSKELNTMVNTYARVSGL